MTEQERPGTARPVSDGDQARPRPIPDGGLGEAMPAWLQAPPAWKRPAVQPSARAIPPPDTSPIDPGSMLADDDLPPWLQVLAVNAGLPGHAHGGDSPPDSTTGVRDVAPVDDVSLPSGPGIVPDEPVAIPTREEVRDASHAGAETGNVATDPVAPAFHEVTVRDEAAPPPTRDKSAWWLSDQAVALLMIAMLLTIIYVVLVASGGV